MNTKKILLALFFVLSALSAVHAQSADEIVSKHLDAIGGVSAWRKINSARFTGAMTIQGTEISVTISTIENKGSRQDITMGGMTGWSFTTPKEGWVYMPFGGQQKPEAMTADQVKMSQDQLDIQGELVDYAKKGHTIEYLGREDLEGTECFKVKLTLKSGTVKTLFFDPATYYKIREVQKVEADGKEVEVTKDFSNFQKLPEGIVVPMGINTMGGEVTIKKYEVNPKIDESLFKAG